MSVTPIRALVVDDEPIAREVLREELEEIDGVEVIAEAENGRQALDQIQTLAPELVFWISKCRGLAASR
jgi:chemotaxis response regulator CheB